MLPKITVCGLELGWPGILEYDGTTVVKLDDSCETNIGVPWILEFDKPHGTKFGCCEGLDC